MEPIVLYYRFGYWTKTLSWSWDSHKECLVLRLRHGDKNHKSKAINWSRVPPYLYFQIFFRILAVTSAILKISLSQSVEASEVIFGAFLLSISFMSIPIHIHYSLNPSAAVQEMNALLQLKRMAGRLAHAQLSLRQLKYDKSAFNHSFQYLLLQTKCFTRIQKTKMAWSS